VTLFGSDGSYALRPERVQLSDEGSAVPPGHGHAPGHVVDVVYAGALVRRVVTLDAGPTWVVTTAAAGDDIPAGPRRGDRVLLTWHDQAVRRLG
jgi:putative spermidine/putrescine transport system ATP-binding protein